MERLTIHTASGAANINYSVGLFSDGKEDYIAKSARRQLAIDRLAAYEDTGLEPETISKIRDIVLDISGNLDRLRELAQADREGRCVVLPCKKGDTVWRIVHDATPHITKDRCTNIKVENKEVWVNLIGDRVMGGWNFGKLLFLNEKEAEVALKAREQDG